MIKNPVTRQIKDNDGELIRAINDGKIDKFQDLVKRYEHRLYNFGLKMCGNVQDAEDMVQDTFLNVFRYLKDFRYETKFKNWMYRIATSTCIKKRRKSKFAPDRELSLEEFLPKDESEFNTELPFWAAQPLDKLLNAELAGHLKNAVVDLPEKYRVVFVLRDIEGFSTVETAEILNLSAANIKVRLHRARLFLRDQLKEYFKDE
ncbi:MAG: sigma-70 family RNA polymerase sigma factor [Desulfobacteraceae bacterium]|nr:sigma-70 family RNA polymerase sigma factor [Desulfobacteraceae bacterium]